LPFSKATRLSVKTRGFPSPLYSGVGFFFPNYIEKKRGVSNKRAVDEKRIFEFWVEWFCFSFINNLLFSMGEQMI